MTPLGRCNLSSEAGKLSMQKGEGGVYAIRLPRCAEMKEFIVLWKAKIEPGVTFQV